MKKILAISGSLRKGSYSLSALELCKKRLSKSAIEVEILNPKEWTLPFCDGSTEYPSYPDYKRLLERAMQADGFILCSPQYHGAVSGTLKNILDLLGSEHFRGKAVGLVSVLGGGMNSNSISQMTSICHTLDAVTVPQSLMIPHSYQAFDESGELTEKRVSTRMDEMLQSLESLLTRLEPEPFS